MSALSIVERLRDAQGLTSGTAQADGLLWDAADTIEECRDLLVECAEFVQPFNRAEELLDRIDAALAKVNGQAPLADMVSV